METITSVIVSILSTVFVAIVSIFACFPDAKISRDITKQLTKFVPFVMGGASGTNEAYFSGNESLDDDGDDEDEGDGSWTKVDYKKKKDNKKKN